MQTHRSACRSLGTGRNIWNGFHRAAIGGLSGAAATSATAAWTRRGSGGGRRAGNRSSSFRPHRDRDPRRIGNHTWSGITTLIAKRPDGQRHRQSSQDWRRVGTGGCHRSACRSLGRSIWNGFHRAAIGGLSGAAATSATAAWFGGVAVAAEGLGIAAASSQGWM